MQNLQCPKSVRLLLRFFFAVGCIFFSPTLGFKARAKHAYKSNAKEKVDHYVCRLDRVHETEF